MVARHDSSAARGDLVLLHGAFCGGWAMAGWARDLTARGWRCHAPDLRHHGLPRGEAAPPALGRTSLLDYAADLEAAITRLPGRPVIVGHSMGGLLAQMLAARGLARALVLLAPSPPWGLTPTTAFELMSGWSLMAALGPFWGDPVPPSYTIAAEHTLDRLPFDERQRLFDRFGPESGRAIFETVFPLLDARQASRVDPLRVPCPVLAVAGGQDQVNPPATVKRIAARYDGAYLCRPACSHWMLSEPGWPDLVAEADAWLAARLPPYRAGG